MGLKSPFPTMIVASEFPTGEILQLADAETSRFQLVDAQASHVLTPPDSAGLIIIRPPATAFSLMLCSYPADFEQAELTPASDGHGRAAFRLFSRFLEKGVILRGRLRVARTPSLLHNGYNVRIDAPRPLPSSPG